MKIKLYAIYFSLYIFITSSCIFLLENNLYSLSTNIKPTGSKVCLVIIDGLRYDTIKNMPFINSITLSQNGVIYKANCEVPSSSRPGYERILTGTSTKINSIDNNNKIIPSPVPSLFSICKKNKIKTAVSGYYWIFELFPFQIDYEYYYIRNDKLTFNMAENLVNLYNPEFLVVHPMEVDTAGHKYGGSSSNYRAAAVNIDNKIKKMWNFLSPKGYTLIVTSDHGHKDTGGHGSGNIKCIETPIVMVSNNLNRLNLSGNKEVKHQIDIAPTICDIMGLPKSIYMVGNSLLNQGSDITAMRNSFSGIHVKNFEAFLNITSLITYFILTLYTIIYIVNFMLLAKFLK